MNTDLMETFQGYYEKPLKQMAVGVRKLLHEQLEETVGDTEPFKSMLHFMDVAERVSQDGSTEINHGMFYGMVWNCWRELHNLYIDRVIHPPVGDKDESTSA